MSIGLFIFEVICINGTSEVVQFNNENGLFIFEVSMPTPVYGENNYFYFFAFSTVYKSSSPS